MFRGSVDEGYLISKSSLPVMKLSYGGAFASESSIHYNLGPLICSGKSQPYPSERDEISRNEMKSKLDDIGSSIAELKSPKTIIAFRATCTKNFPGGERTHHSESPVIWKNVEYNIGNAFNAETGVFTSPYDGIYSFHATSSMIGQVEGHISIRADGSTNVQNYFRNNGDHEYKHINPHGQFRLKKGARVCVVMTGTFYRPSSICHRTYFQGHLIDLL